MPMWRQLVIDSVIRPRQAARAVLALGLPLPALVQAAVAITCLGIVLGFIAIGASSERIDVLSAAILVNPLIGAAAQLAVMAATVVLTWRVGLLFGGRGSFHGALSVVVWLNAMMVLIQSVQLVFLAVLPPLAAVVAVATIFWALWAFASFVAELHGFQNAFFVLAGLILTMLVLFLTLSMLLVFFGVMPQEAS